MGQDKLSLAYNGTTLGNHAVLAAAASQLEKVLVITRSHVHPSWLDDHPKVTAISCPDSYKGQAESLKCGIREAVKSGADAALITLADQPFVTTGHIDMLVAMQMESAAPFFATRIRNIQPPVLFSSKLFPDLLTLSGDHGARELLKGKLIEQGRFIDISEETPFFDIDTEEDYQLLLRLSRT